MRKRVLTLCLAAVMALGLCACGEDQTAETPAPASSTAPQPIQVEGTDWAPDMPVQMIVADKAGSARDTAARLLARYAESYVGQSVIIENIDGKGGVTGWTKIGEGGRKGYVLGFVDLPELWNGLLDGRGKDKYRTNSYEPVCGYTADSAVVLVPEDSPFQTLKELAEYAAAYRGRVRAATDGEGGFSHIGAQLFARSAKFTYEHVPCAGTAEAIWALRRGEADFCVVLSADCKDFAGKVRMLGVFDTQRMDAYPDVPTLKELGYHGEWYGSACCIVGQKRTLSKRVRFYAGAFKAMMEDPEFLAAAKEAGIQIRYMDSEQTGVFMEEQYTFLSRTVKTLWIEEEEEGEVEDDIPGAAEGAPS